MKYPVPVKCITGKFVCCRAISATACRSSPVQTQPPERAVREIFFRPIRRVGLDRLDQLPRRQKRGGKKKRVLAAFFHDVTQS